MNVIESPRHVRMKGDPKAPNEGQSRSVSVNRAVQAKTGSCSFQSSKTEKSGETVGFCPRPTGNLPGHHSRPDPCLRPGSNRVTFPRRSTVGRRPPSAPAQPKAKPIFHGRRRGGGGDPVSGSQPNDRTTGKKGEPLPNLLSLQPVNARCQGLQGCAVGGGVAQQVLIG